MSLDPYRRLEEHNSGKVRSTKSKKPYKVLLIEEFPDHQSVRYCEKYYKIGFGRKVCIKKIHNNSQNG